MLPYSSLFTVGSVLSRTFSILKENPAVFFSMALIAVLPSAIAETILADTHTSLLIAQLLGIVLSLVIQGAIAYAVFIALRGEPSVSINEAVSRGTARLGTLILAAILMSFGLFVGFLLLLIPGLILMCMWAITIPACVVEGLGPIDSLKRSAKLTKGYRGTIFALAVFAGIFVLVFAGGSAVLVALLTESERFGGLVGSILAFLPVAFSAVMYAVIYYDLRMLKEGVSIDKLAHVFD